MKRLLGVLVLSLAVSHSALAVTTIPWTKEGCESVKGTWVTAHSPTDAGCDEAHCNGLNFCRSQNNQMNWWSAMIWCKSIGHKLVDLETACPGGLVQDRTCANLCKKISGWSWTNQEAEVPGSTRALFNDACAIANRYVSNNGPLALKVAICEE